MELVYLWIEEFKNIRKQGFNFSPKHHFTFTPIETEGEKIISGKLEKEDFVFPDNFFAQGTGENIIQNITAVIGANGCGKSSLLEAILTFSLGSDSEIILPPAEIYQSDGLRGVWVLKNDNGKFIVFTNLPNINLTSSFDDFIEKNYSLENFPFTGKEHSKKRNYQRCHFVKEGLGILPVYYTNIFREEIIIAKKEDKDDYVYYENDTEKHAEVNRYDISINQLFKNQVEHTVSVKLYYWEEMERIINFIREFWIWFEKGNALNFQLPKYAQIKFQFKSPLLSMPSLNKYFIEGLIFPGYEAIDYILLEERAKIELHILELWLEYYFEKVKADYPHIESILSAKLSHIEIDKEINQSDPIHEAYNLFSEVIINQTSPIESPVYESLPDSHLFIKQATEFIEAISANPALHFENTFDIITETALLLELVKEIRRVRFLSLYKFSFSFKKDITQATMSSGEKNFLVLFSRLYEIKKEIDINEKNIDSILLLLDEAELTLHPDWQTHFVEYIIEGVNKIFEGYNVQIILTSHSPFVVSDLPKSNIIFLQKDKDGMCSVKDSDIGNTFGANIHTLLKKSFFLENGLMGSFAKKKIDQLIIDLNNGSERTTEIQQQINMIGEPFLREQIQRLYDEGNSVSARISKLEKELAELRTKVEPKTPEQ